MSEVRSFKEFSNDDIVSGLIEHLEKPCFDSRNPEHNLLYKWIELAKENLAILKEEGDVKNIERLQKAIKEAEIKNKSEREIVN